MLSTLTGTGELLLLLCVFCFVASRRACACVIVVFAPNVVCVDLCGCACLLWCIVSLALLKQTLDCLSYIEFCEFTDLVRRLRHAAGGDDDYDAAERAARHGFHELGKAEDSMLRFSDVIRWFEEVFDDGAELQQEREEQEEDAAGVPVARTAVAEQKTTANEKSGGSDDGHVTPSMMSVAATASAPLVSRSEAYAAALVRRCCSLAHMRLLFGRVWSSVSVAPAG